MISRSASAAAACWLTAGIAYVSLEAFTAAAKPGYRYTHDFISDLGRPDSPLHPLMNTAFALQGTFFLAGAGLLARAGPGAGTRFFVACAAANAVGNVVVACVPSGSTGIAGVHVAGAVLAIVGGNLAILAGLRTTDALRLSRSHRTASIALAGLGLSSFVLLAIASTTSRSVLVPDAVWERGSVYTIIAWQLATAVLLLTGRPRDVRY